MKSLSKIQKDFQNYLLYSQTELHQDIVETPNLPKETRLNIYRNAYQARLTEALSNNFPNLNKYLGCDHLQQLALAYMQAYPSTYRSIRWFGDKLVAFIYEQYPEEHHYLAELAAFEWAMTLAFDAEDATICRLEDLAAVPADAWANLRFKLHPSVQRMHFFWNIIPIWEALEHNQTPTDPQKEALSTPWLLWRQHYLNRFYALAEDEAFAMDALAQGEPFAAICEGLCQWHDEEQVGIQAASFLKNWIMAGQISEIII